MKLPWFGIALIVVGGVLFLDRSGFLSFGWGGIFWIFLALFGAWKLITSFPSREAGGAGGSRGGVFWGTMFLLFGLTNLLEHLDVVDLSSYLFVPLLLGMAGLAFLMLFVSWPREWHVLVPAVVCIGLGAITTAAELGTFDRWELREVVGTYWPVALILFGAALLLNRNSAGSRS